MTPLSTDILARFGRRILTAGIRRLGDILTEDADGDGIPDGLEAALDRAEALAADTRSPVDDLGIDILRAAAAAHPEWASEVYGRLVKRANRAAP